MEKKRSILEKMKESKSFLDHAETKEKANQMGSTLEKSQVPELQSKREKKEEEEEKEELSLFSEPSTLFKKKGSEWNKVSSGRIIGKIAENKGVQLLFTLNNTRIVMNTLVSDISNIKQEGAHLLFPIVEEETYEVACLLLKDQEKAKEIQEKLEEQLAKMSPPGIEPGTSSV